MDMEKQKRWLESEARIAISELANRNGFPAPNMRISWDLRGFSVAGEVTGYAVRLNPDYLKAMGASKYLPTVIHEVCHVGVNAYRLLHRGGRNGAWSAHGAHWKRMMVSLGQSPDRTITDAEWEPIKAKMVQASGKPLHPVHCGCPTPHYFGTRKFNSVKKGVGYRCRKCRQLISATPQVDALRRSDGAA